MMWRWEMLLLSEEIKMFIWLGEGRDVDKGTCDDPIRQDDWIRSFAEVRLYVDVWVADVLAVCFSHIDVVSFGIKTGDVVDVTIEDALTQGGNIPDTSVILIPS